MKKQFQLIVVSLFLSTLASAQLFVIPKVIATGPNNCDYTVVVEGINLPSNYQIMREGITVPGMSYHTIGDTIIGYCMDDQLSYAFGQDTILFSLMISQTGLFQIINYTEPSTFLANDGSLTIKFDSIQENDPWVYDPNFDLYTITTTDNQTYIIENIQHGSIQIGSSSSYGLGYNSTNGYIGDPSEFLINNNLHVDVSFVDSDNNCTGSIQLDPINAVGNVTYQWNNDSTVIANSQQNLCPGHYSIYATDDNQQEALIQVTITDMNNTYTDPSVFTFIAGDTTSFDFLNCAIDFNLPIDSINYSETLIPPPSASPLEYQFELIVYQGVNSFLFSDNISIGIDSNIYINTVIYCQALKSTFQGKRINFVRHGAAVLASLTSLEKNQMLTIYPNPTNGSITIDGKKTNGILTDINGKKLLDINSDNISLENLKSGIYFLTFEKNQFVYKIVKY